MTTKVEQVDLQAEVKRYNVQYPISAYTFPREARIHAVRFDEQHMHVELTDGRVLSVPLWWIPTLYNASAAEREKYELDRHANDAGLESRQCAINDEVRVTDYLNPGALGP